MLGIIIALAVANFAKQFFWAQFALSVDAL